MAKTSGIQDAVAKFDGSPTKLAAAIGAGVLRQHVEHWLKTGRVPAEHAPKVRELTGIQLWRLCPENWHRIWPELVKVKGAPAIPAQQAA